MSTAAGTRRGRGRPKENASQPPATVTADATSSVEPEASQVSVRRSTCKGSRKLENAQESASGPHAGQRLATPASSATRAPEPTIPELSLAEEGEMFLDLDRKDEEDEMSWDEDCARSHTACTSAGFGDGR
jgi:hypothetical protein